jgi:hypothetical protein
VRFQDTTAKGHREVMFLKRLWFGPQEEGLEERLTCENVR